MGRSRVFGAFAHRSRAEWSARALLAIGAAWFGYQSASLAFADTLRSKAPERAHLLAPDNALIAAALSRSLSGAKATAMDRARADALSRAALRRDPASATAASVLGLNAQVRGDTPTARRTFAYVGKLTRRDLTTQLWAIEDAVARSDIPGALRSYDLALRTSRYAPDLLFPVLAGSIVEPSVRQHLMRILAVAPWARDFTVYAAAASPDPRATAALLYDMRRSRLVVPEVASARLIEALLAAGDAEAAWRYYSSMHPGAGRSTSRDPRFKTRLSAPTQFDWRPIDDVVTASIEAAQEGGHFDFAAPAAAGGPVLRQMQVLAPGEYVIQGMANIEQAATSNMYWLLACADGRELGRVGLAHTGQFAGTVRVPIGCPIQSLTLEVRPEGVAGVAGQVTDVRVHPASTRQ